MVKIDLHMHSTHSDGVFNPKELIDFAVKRKVPAIAITDHDKVTANKEAENYAREKGIEYVSGIEITATPPEGVKELHIVGLFVNSENDKIKNIWEKHKEYAIDTAKKIIKNLNDLGYEITFEELSKETKGENFGRPFIAKLLMKKYPDKFKERKQVFNELLGKEGKAFVPAKGEELEEAIKAIHDSGGVAMVAHPWFLGENMIKILKEFVLLGGDGIELDYKLREDISEETHKFLKEFVIEHNLIISGGTDFHEKKEGESEIGDFGLTKEEFRRLKEYWKNKQNKKN
jgi:predicted metal-dependent phosphoesterase TrpH